MALLRPQLAPAGLPAARRSAPRGARRDGAVRPRAGRTVHKFAKGGPREFRSKPVEARSIAPFGGAGSITLTPPRHADADMYMSGEAALSLSMQGAIPSAAEMARGGSGPERERRLRGFSQDRRREGRIGNARLDAVPRGPRLFRESAVHVRGALTRGLEEEGERPKGGGGGGACRWRLGAHPLP